jgi:hypothetical protein
MGCRLEVKWKYTTTRTVIVLPEFVDVATNKCLAELKNSITQLQGTVVAAVHYKVTQFPFVLTLMEAQFVDIKFIFIDEILDVINVVSPQLIRYCRRVLLDYSIPFLP